MNIFVKVVACSVISVQFLSAVDPNLIPEQQRSTNFAPVAALRLHRHIRKPSDDIKPPICIDGHTEINISPSK